jgi:Tfp pilus assembly protein PilN
MGVPEQVFGLSANQVQAYAAVGNVLLATVLAAITFYYARHAKRQADASKDLLDSSNRQADAAQRTLDLLLKEKEQQRKVDTSAVTFQVQAAIEMIDDWRRRIESESFDLPDVIQICSTSFTSTISSAERIDGVVAGYMGAALLYIDKAQTDALVLRSKEPNQRAGILEFNQITALRKRLQERAGYNLNIARFKLLEAQTRLTSVVESRSNQSTES